MTRACDLTGKKVQFGHNVSKAKNKTKRKFIPNLQKVTFRSEVLNRNVRLSVATSSIRTVAKHGSIDDYLIKVKNNKLSPRAKLLKKTIVKKTTPIAA
ncbi:MAG: 50S ribosomal protein L28 [Candidatus Pelagibacterales bacterium]|jgi:large subunit ribosomal protein L28|tara:strand:- start:5806 stop:6099 length:294 start_codon:yes stop_codon:yes gene_type:complete